MPKPRIFVSSTCYDLVSVRSEIKSFIDSLGYESVLSEHSDVLFDPREHTHESCAKEVSTCDMLVLIIGSRFGGISLPSLSELTIGKNPEFSKLEKDQVSITQIEVLHAISNGTPVYTFVQESVMSDHYIYEKNKNKPFVSEIEFPSIEKQDTAKYIFEFINLLRRRSSNNAIYKFSDVGSIRNQLREQWASLFQRLLMDSIRSNAELQSFRTFSEQIEDLKTVMLASVETPKIKNVAKNVLKFRYLVEVLLSFDALNIFEIIYDDVSFDDLMINFGIDRIEGALRKESYRPEIYFIKNDGTFYAFRGTEKNLSKLSMDWEDFRRLERMDKEAVVEALRDARDARSNFYLRSFNIPFEEYIKRTGAGEGEGVESE